MEATCPSCQKKYLRVRPELIGKKAQCTCGHTFKLGDTSPASTPAAAGDSVDLSSAAVFENSYSDLDQILSGRGSSAPLPARPTKPNSEATATNLLPGKTLAPSTAQTNREAESTLGYGGTGMSVGFLVAMLSGSLAAWFSLFVLSSRFYVLEFQPLNLVSQTLHDSSLATFGDLLISPGIERSFVVLGWVIWIAAACLLALGVGQLINAFAKLFRRRSLLAGIDGITGLTAIVLLFMLLSTIFVHFSHMREINRDLVQKAGGQIDENTVLGRNFQELQATHSDHSRQFMTSMIVASSAPLFICLLSLSRVYVTLGEPEFTPQRRGNP